MKVQKMKKRRARAGSLADIGHILDVREGGGESVTDKAYRVMRERLEARRARDQNACDGSSLCADVDALLDDMGRMSDREFAAACAALRLKSAGLLRAFTAARVATHAAEGRTP